MAISRAKKEAIVARYLEVLAESDGFVVAEFKALTVAEAEQLRHKLRETDSEFIIVKNTLLRIALEQAGWPVPEDLLAGQSGVAFSKGKLPDMTKALIEYAKSYEAKFSLKGGVMGAETFTADQVEAISKLPTLPEVQAQILGILVQPASQLVGIVQAGTASIVNVLQAHIDQNLKGDGASDESAA